MVISEDPRHSQVHNYCRAFGSGSVNNVLMTKVCPKLGCSVRLRGERSNALRHCRGVIYLLSLLLHTLICVIDKKIVCILSYIFYIRIK